MGEQTGIQWTDHTFNPWWGCTKVSPGCAHCYAETFDHRLGGDHWGDNKPRKTFGDKHWNEPRKWNEAAKKAGKHRRVFCASMADVFDELAPEGQLERLLNLIYDTPWLDWQILTKRTKRMHDFVLGSAFLINAPVSNIWWGTTCEDQQRYDERSDYLYALQEIGYTTFLSLEPLLSPIKIHLPSWVIVGGESGAGARPMDANWVRSLRDHCTENGIPFFFKQWGGVNKKLTGHILDGKEWHQFPHDKNICQNTQK